MSDNGRPPHPPQAQGTLEKRPLPHLLAYAIERRLTGSLIFGSIDAPVGVVVLESGEPVKANARAVAESDTWNGLADLASTTAFAYYPDFDGLQGRPRREVPALDALLRVLQRKPPRPHFEAALQRLGTASLVVPATVTAASLGLVKDAAKAFDRLRQNPFTLETLRREFALKAIADAIVYGLLISKVGQAFSVPAATQSSARLPAVRQSAPEIPAPESSDSSAVGRVRLARSSIKVSPLKEEPTVVSRNDDRASKPPPPRQPSSAALPQVAVVPPPKPNLSPELLARRQEVLDRAAAIDGMNYFEMLEIAEDTPTTQVQAAFFKLAKKWHPDRLPNDISEVRDACARVFSRLSEATSTLTNEDSRNRYMRALSEGGASPDEQEKIAAVLEAAAYFQKAEVMMKRGDMARTEEFCAEAVRLDPQPDYVSLLAWVESQKPANQSPEASRRLLDALSGAIAQSDRCERAYFYRGAIRKRLGDHSAAIQDFRRAFELNPRNLDAQREVRLHEMRLQKEAEAAAAGKGTPGPQHKPSFMGRIFKK